MDKESAKQKIADLIAKYKATTPAKLKGLNEESTKSGFIRPLFEALGWDFENTDEVAPEETISNGRVDYAFKLHGVSQFYVEAKPFKEDVNDPKHIKQAVSYAYSKGVTWAILTNFQALRVFNAQKQTPFISIDDCGAYLTDFERLWLLSRDSLESGLLNQEAVKWGVLPTSVPIEKRLFTSMREWREGLFNQIFKYNDKMNLTPEQVDEVIQRFFDRLIFIRTAEDRGIEEKGVLALLHQWKSGGQKGELFGTLKQLFKEYEGYYDSDLFSKHLLDNPELFVDNDLLETLLNGLYEIPGSMANYNFNDIDADVLGAVYEQYLGHVAEVVKRRAQEAQMKLDLGISAPTYKLTAKKERRKEHGIYYTPKYVTDYIVRETVGRFLAENAGYPDKLHNVKILDPACGSGSFLIRAYDELLNYRAHELQKPVHKLDQWERLPILTNNIFGVDLDKQAVEIARLNLMLRSLAKHEPLPYLGDNIKRGNSLISGTEEELNKYFGDKWQETTPFNWEDEFDGVMKNGGFDIVIGNPPYIRQEQLQEFKLCWQNIFKCYNGAADIYVYFFERGLQLLRQGGFLAYITPNKYFRSGYGQKLRDFLSTKTTIVQIVDFGDAPVFDAITYPSIIVLRKATPSQNKTRIFTWKPNLPIEKFSSVVTSNSSFISQKDLRADGWRLESDAVLNLLEKLRKSGKPLTEYVNGRFYRGIVTGLNEAFVVNHATRDCLVAEHPSSTDLLKPFLRGKDIRRWRIEASDLWLIFTRRGVDIKRYPAIQRFLSQYKKQLTPGTETGRKPGSYEWYEIQDNIAYWREFEEPMIVWGNLAIQPKFAFADAGYYVSAPANIIVSDSRYLLGVLNSQVTRYLVSQSAAERQGGYLEYKPMYISPLAIPKQPDNEHISGLVNTILSAKAKDPEADVSALERQIDELVYQLYGLTEDERKIVEENT